MNRISATAFAISLAWVLVFLGSGCSHLGPGQSGAPCPVAWVPSEAIDPVAATLRARMNLRIGDEEVHLEIITESRPEEVVVVALARFGVRLFAVRQRGVEVLVDGASTVELERLAIWTLDALHRVYWIEAPQDSSEIQWTRTGETIRESRANGVRHREFSLRPTDDATRRVTIDYARPTIVSDTRSGAVAIRNPWCGYEAAIAPIRSAKRNPD